MSISISQIRLLGFRAYLQEQKIPLSVSNTARSLALFAPNGKGKSSLVDAIEYFFSIDGTLKRLGKRASGGQAGPQALAHVECEKHKIIPSVELEFRTDSGRASGIRTLAGSETALPKVARNVLDLTKLEFIIRGFELRRFVLAVA